MELRTQIRFAGMGIAAAAILSATSAEAQKTTIGPFVDNPIKNPLPPPAFDNLTNSAISYLDYDNDGDLDVILTGENKSYRYYTNVGDKNVARFRQGGLDNYPFEISLPGPTGYGPNPARFAFADIDHDGDQDMVATVFQSTYFDDPDPILFFRNTGNDKEPVFTDDGTNPFGEFSVQRNGTPAFADVDGDGDMDLVVAGYYNDKANPASMQYFRNDQTDNTPGVDPTFTRLAGEDNPLYLDGDFGEISLNFGDLDEDGDQDLIYTSDSDFGLLHYKRNDDGTFVEQDDDWVFNEQDHSATTGNPLKPLSLVEGYNDYKSITLADLDGDGDLDATISINLHDYGTGDTNYVYFENVGHGVFKKNTDGINLLSGTVIGSNAASFFYDYDGDGDQDIVATSTTSTGSGCEGGYCETYTYKIGPTVYYNDNGKFTPQGISLNPFPADLPDYGAAKLVDIDGDDDLDLMIITPYDPENGRALGVDYYANENGEYVKKTGAENPFDFVSGLDTYRVYLDLADLDDDGLLDLVIHETDQDPSAYQNTGTKANAVFTRNDEWSAGFEESFIYQDASVTLNDVDNDGDYDIIIGKYGEIWYYENQGTAETPAFHLYRRSSGEGDPTGWDKNPFQDIIISGLNVPNLADIDGDGDLDMLAVDSYYGTFGFLENQNPAPAVATKGSTSFDLVVNEAITLGPELTIFDSDNDAIVKITVAIAPYEKGIEKLQLPAAGSYPNLDISWDDDKGILTITGNATVGDYTDALDDVQYLYTGPDSGGRKAGRKSSANRTVSKTITFTTLDADLTVGPSNTTTFNIGHSNEAPVITPTSFSAAYTNIQVAAFPSIVLSDDDDANLASATVSFDASYKPSEDRLVMNLTGSIAPSFNTTTGVLTLTGSGTVAQYQAALRAVMYDNTLGASGTSGIRALNVTVNDGETNSNVGTTQLSVNGAVNTPPTISSGAAAPFYVSGDLVINNTIVVGDAEGVISGATITIGSGFQSTEDLLLFDDQNGITGNYSSSNGTLSLTGSATVANYQAALRSVKYRNATASPSTDDRIVTFSVTDGGTPVSITTTITINKPPVIKAPEKKTAASNGNVAFPITAITDPDDNLDISTLVVTSTIGTVLIQDGLITIDYTSNGDKKNVDEITITVCDTGGRCKTQNIEVELGALAMIYDAISPNGDGINDSFYIENLPKQTHVAIYDRWGDAIFETDEYDNDDPSKRFDGKNKNGNDVVGGTYFYKIKFKDQQGTQAGVIILNR